MPLSKPDRSAQLLPGHVASTDGLGPNAWTVGRLRGPQPVRCEICQWRGRRDELVPSCIDDKPLTPEAV